jgi:voltage-gated potassium channel
VPRARQHRVLGSPTRLPVIALAFSLVYGTVGYVIIEGFGVLDALYMTVTTLTTVGFGEIEPLDPAGRVFTLSLSLGAR